MKSPWRAGWVCLLALLASQGKPDRAHGQTVTTYRYPCACDPCTGCSRQPACRETCCQRVRARCCAVRCWFRRHCGRPCPPCPPAPCAPAVVVPPAPGGILGAPVPAAPVPAVPPAPAPFTPPGPPAGVAPLPPAPTP